MAHDAQGPATGPQKLVIRNIGLLLSGAIENPILDADTVVAENGRITAIGRAKDVDQEHATLVIDANGTALTPGLIDSHVHPVAGDWTPRQNQIGWIDSNLNGGVTVGLKPGFVNTIPVTKKRFEADQPWVTITGFRIKIDGCAGQSFIRSYATFTSSTDNTDDVVTYLGPTKAV